MGGDGTTSVLNAGQHLLIRFSRTFGTFQPVQHQQGPLRGNDIHCDDALAERASTSSDPDPEPDPEPDPDPDPHLLLLMGDD